MATRPVLVFLLGLHGIMGAAPVHAGCAAGQENFYGTCVNRLSLLGQASWKQTAAGAVVAHSLGGHASGLAIDRSVKPNRIYVADTANNRILGFASLGTCSLVPATPCTNDSDCAAASAGTCTISGAPGWPFHPPFRDADIIIGQPDAGGSACNGDDNVGIYGPASASTLCLMQTPAIANVPESWQFMNFDVDQQGNLYVTDRHNNRVLRYNQPFSADKTDGRGDAVADLVFGQADFSSNLPNRGGAVSADTLFLNFGAFANFAIESFGGVMVDPHGNVWIADFGNARVLRFPDGSTMPNLVLGQPDFTTTAPGPLDGPFSAVLDPDRGELYVLDHNVWANLDRIVVFGPDPVAGDFTSGMAPERTFTPRHPVSYPRGTKYRFSASGLTLNRYKAGRYARGRIWAYENHPGKRAVLLNGRGHFVAVIGAPKASTLGGPAWGDGHPQCTSSSYPYRLSWPGGSGAIDDDGNLYVADEGFGRVAVYHLPTYAPLIENRVKCPPKPNALLLGGDEVPDGRFLGLYTGAYAVGGQLFADDWGSRILVWNDYTNKAIGAPADFVLNAETNDGRFSAADDQGHLWMSGPVFKLPVTAATQAPIATNVPVYWGDDPTTQAATIGRPAFDPVQRKLWIPDGNRVLRISNASSIESGDKLLVDLVIGQTTKSSNECNQGQSSPSANTLCHAEHINFDHSGNLYVVESDYECQGNHRITVFKAEDIAAASGMFPNISARIAFGGTLTTPGDCVFSPVAVAFDSRNEMVVANDGGTFVIDFRTRAVQQLLFFPTPLTRQVPSATIQVPMGAPGDVQFDDSDNLIIRDHTWHRVWVVNLGLDPFWLVPE
jgi:hypothetical protein